jgi:hypothetical protein
LVFNSDFLVLATGPVEPAFDFAASFLGAALVNDFAGVFIIFETLFAAGLAEALAFEPLEADFAGVAAFFAFETAFCAAFFGATVTFGKLTSR